MINFQCTLNTWKKEKTKVTSQAYSIKFTIYYTSCIIYMPLWVEGVISGVINKFPQICVKLETYLTAWVFDVIIYTYNYLFPLWCNPKVLLHVDEVSVFLGGLIQTIDLFFHFPSHLLSIKNNKEPLFDKRKL